MSTRNTPKRPWTANPAILFLCIVGLASLFVFLLSFKPQLILRPLDVFTARVFAKTGSTLGVDIVREGNSIILTWGARTRQFIVGYGCDSLLAFLILVSAILPFPCHWKSKLVGLAGGIIFVFLMNQARLAGLAAALFLVKEAEDFSFYHTSVGQGFGIVMIFFFWMYWAEKVVKAERNRQQADPGVELPKQGAP